MGDDVAMTTKQQVLDVVENTVEVVNRFGDVVAEGFRTENWATGFRLSDNTIIRFDQIAEAQQGKVVLK